MKITLTLTMLVLACLLSSVSVCQPAKGPGSTKTHDRLDGDLGMPAFEVATIKPSATEAENGNLRLGANRVIIENYSLHDLIRLAFGLHDSELANAESPLTKRHYDIEAITGMSRAPSFVEVQDMLRSLLGDRFGLRFHYVEKDLPTYDLLLDRQPTLLHLHKGPPSTRPTQTGQGGSSANTRTRIFTNNTLDEFAQGLSTYVDRPIVNKTALTDRYDIVLSWASDNLSVTSASTGPALATAIHDQLGLRFKASHGLVRVLIVDQLTAPTPD